MVKVSDSPYYGLLDVMNRQHVTQAELAELIGVRRPTFSNKVNRYKGADFSFHEACLIADKLKINPAEFF